MRKLFQKTSTKYGELKENIVPVSMRLSLTEKSLISFSNKITYEAVCLNCLSHPCMNYDSDQIAPDVLHEMPSSHTTKVCPSDAITTDATGFPSIDPIKCFSCGLCIARCKYAAISFNKDNKAIINKGDIDPIIWVENLDMSRQKERDQAYLNIPLITKEKIRLNKEYFISIYQQLDKNCKAINGFDNLLVRNLLINLGIKSKVRAIGNNDIRFDLIGTIESKILLGEIGLNGIDILEEPRAILDDIAVLNSRYSIRLENILSLIVTLSFPNKRSDVYEVIYDINNVLNIKILSVSIHLLIILNLLRRKLDKVNDLKTLSIDKNNKSLKDSYLKLIPELAVIDPFFFDGEFYRAVK